ncbi:MAG TPA: VOC family protein [Candidatus Dormibacteraeota bacterium]|nr:VOC family protein [Candidatus Dormibacteraeota bacterium]
MLNESKAFSGFSVNDLAAAKNFYGEVLSVPLEEIPAGLRLKIGNGILVYPKPDHVPATYTMLNFRVDDIEKAVSELNGKGVAFENYKGVTDEKGIARGIAHNRGPDIAWFKDPAGNILSVLKEG